MNKLLQHVITGSLVSIIILAASSHQPLTAQEDWDNPNFDRIPLWYFDTIQNTLKEPAQVITINDYDNFFLGVDFAEANISNNPASPTEFFTSFNTDKPHGTTDGFNWYAYLPVWSASMWGDPVVTHDSLGNLYYENMYGSGTIQGCKVAVSSNNGQTWNNPAVTAITGVDKNWIAADQTAGPYSNSVYTVMTSASGGNFARSTNLGVSFQNTATFGTQSLPGMMVCVGPNGNIQGGAVYVVTNGGNTFASTYTFYRSLNGGSSFTLMSSQNFAGYVGVNSNSRHSVENMRTRPYPFICADNSYGPNRGRLYCVYATNDPPGNGNKPDVWVRYSDNGGSSWSAAIRINDDPNPTTHHQFAPAPWCDKNTGRLYVQWMDTRDCPTSDSALIYGTYSDDGGVTFMPNVAISNKKMKINCTTCGGGGTPRYQGDYNGITSNDKVAMAVWTDFRNGNFASYVGYFPDYAMHVFPEELEMAGQDTIWAVVPDVKLYSDTVVFIATIEQPASGSFTLSYPEGDILTNFPDSIPIVITAEDVPLGEYTFSLTGQGPNGTPIHKRQATVVLDELPPPAVAFSASDSTVCTGNEVQFTDLTLNLPTQWFWTFDGGTPNTSNEQNPVVVYNNPGVFDVTLIAINATGPSELQMPDFISVEVAPEMPTGEDVYACLPGEIPSLEVTGENITWYSDPELTQVVNTGNVFPTGQTEPGEYMYYVTQSAGGCESQPLVITLFINDQPEATLAAFDAVCDNEPAFELSGGEPAGGIYYGSGIFENVFDPGMAGAGTHPIGYVYTDENFCSDTAFQDLTVYASPVVELGNDTTICANITFTLDATAANAVSYLWSPGGQTTATIEVDSMGIGIGSQEFSVVVTTAEGCSSTDLITLTFQDCSGVGEISGLDAISIFPNPSDGLFTLEILSSKSLELELQLLNSTGKVMFGQPNLKVAGRYSENLTIPGLSAGVYYLMLKNPEGKVMKKIMIR